MWFPATFLASEWFSVLSIHIFPVAAGYFSSFPNGEVFLRTIEERSRRWRV